MLFVLILEEGPLCMIHQVFHVDLNTKSTYIVK